MLKNADIDWPTVAKMFGGGALLGGGLGATTSLMHYLNSLHEQAEEQNDTSADDNILYLTLPGHHEHKMASAANTASTFAAGSLGSILGSYLAYTAVRDAYQKKRRQQVQSDLDRSQNVYLGNLQQTAGLEKGASQFGLLSRGVGSVYLAALLSALGSAVVANKVLQKQFPPMKSPLQGMPRKIVLRSENEPDDVSPVDSPDSAEALLRTHLGAKSASISGFADLVNAAAGGRCQEIYDNADNLDLLFESVKGAKQASSVRNNMAITWLCAQPKVAAAIKPLLASWIAEDSPMYFKLASHLDPEVQRNVAGFVTAVVPEIRKSIYAPIYKKLASVKSAESEGMDDLVLSHALETLLAHPDEDEYVHPTNVPQSRESMPPDLNAHGPALEVEDEDALHFLEQHRDALASTLARV